MPQGVATTPRAHESTLANLIFVGLNRRVIALDRFTGQEVWVWKAPKGTGFVSVLLDGDRLIVGSSGYVYCLDPVYGQRVWENPLKGYGQGLMSLVSVNGSTQSAAVAAVIASQRAAAAAGASGAVGPSVGI